MHPAWLSLSAVHWGEEGYGRHLAIPLITLDHKSATLTCLGLVSPGQGLCSIAAIEKGSGAVQAAS